jgi:hypothetical protein
VTGSPAAAGMTFAQRWETVVAAHGGRPFLIFEGPDQSITAMNMAPA